MDTARPSERIASILKKPFVRLALAFGVALVSALLSLGRLAPEPKLVIVSATPLPAGDGHLRFDGLYRATTLHGGNALCLRFYPDGGVVGEDSTGSLEWTAPHLDRRRERTLRGRYRLQGPSIDFSLQAAGLATDCTGTVGEDVLIVYLSQRRSHYAATVKFAFYPVGFPSE